MSKFTKLIRVGIMLLVCAAFAKTTHAQGDLPGAQVRVEKLFDARLADAKRVELSPSLPQLDTSILAQRYEVIAIDPDIAYDPPKIRPLAVKTEEPPRPYKGFVRAGIGLPLGWIGDAAYLTRNDQLALRADIHTYGFKGNFNEDQQYAEVDTRLGGTYYTSKGLAVDLDLSYDRRQFRYFGYEETPSVPDVELPDDALKQHFGIFGFQVGVRNATPTVGDIDYYARIGTRLLRDNFATKENSTLFELGARRGFGYNWYAEAAVNVDLTSFEAISDQSLHNYIFAPAVGAHFEQLGFRLGASVTNSSDTFRVFPDLDVSYGLGGGFVVVAGADGGLRKNNYNNLTNYLPYLVSDPIIRNAEEWRIYAGLQGQTRGVNYKATASYSRINKLAVFLPDNDLVYRFRPSYDTANIIGVRLEASMPINERLSGRLQVENRIFSLDRYDEPHLLPSFDVQLTAGYAVIPYRFTAKAILHAQNRLPTIDYTDTEGNSLEATNAQVDLSVHGTYFFSQYIGGFAQLNNVFNNRRRKFPFYPNLGTNVLIGVVGRF